jgi:N-sulfoglucosamine sulfohydrolase
MNPFRLVRLFCVSLWIAFSAAATSTERPNIVLVTADDLGLQLGCYGDERVATPRLDRFASEGVRFLHAFVTQASCSSSRSSLLTGLYPSQNGQIGLENRGYEMSKAFPSAPTLLHKAGYRTGIVGKLHVGPAAAFHFDFDRSANHATVTRDRETMAAIVDEFLGADDDRPFFFMVNYFDPHVPFVSQVKGLPAGPVRPDDVEPWPFQGGVDSGNLRRRIADYYSCVERLDTLFGDLVDALERRGVAENTVVIFISDNGPPFTLAKATELNAGVHVPLIVRWPGAMQAGTVSPGLVSGVDVFASILDAAGVTAPAQAGWARSLRPLLRGRVPGDWRKHVVTEFTAHQPFAFFPQRSITDGDHRLVRNLLLDTPNPQLDIDSDEAYVRSWDEAYDGSVVRMIFDRHRQPPPVELYDLRTDPHCLYNLADEASYRSVRIRLEQALNAWMVAIDDPLRTTEGVEALRRLHEASGGERWPQAFNRERK